MAVAAQGLSFYDFSQVAPVSNPTLMLNENGTVSYGSATLSSGAGQSLLSSFGEGSNFGIPTWPESLYASYNTTSLFNLQNFSTPFEDPSPDLFLGSDSDFFNQINGMQSSLASTPAVMHPNLVSTLKSIVAPGPGSPRQDSPHFSYHTCFDQPTTTQQQVSRFQQQQNDRLGSSLLSYAFKPSDVKPIIVAPRTDEADCQAVPLACSQSLKVIALPIPRLWFMLLQLITVRLPFVIAPLNTCRHSECCEYTNVTFAFVATDRKIGKRGQHWGGSSVRGFDSKPSSIPVPTRRVQQNLQKSPNHEDAPQDALHRRLRSQ